MGRKIGVQAGSSTTDRDLGMEQVVRTGRSGLRVRVARLVCSGQQHTKLEKRAWGELFGQQKAGMKMRVQRVVGST